VIGIEAANQVLRRLAAALVLRGDEPRGVVQDLLCRRVRTKRNFLRGDLDRRRRGLRTLSLDDDLLRPQRRSRASRRDVLLGAHGDDRRDHRRREQRHAGENCSDSTHPFVR